MAKDLKMILSGSKILIDDFFDSLATLPPLELYEYFKTDENIRLIEQARPDYDWLSLFKRVIAWEPDGSDAITVAMLLAGVNKFFTHPDILKISDQKGWTVAHEQARRGWTTENSEILALKDSKGQSVADIIEKQEKKNGL